MPEREPIFFEFTAADHIRQSIVLGLSAWVCLLESRRYQLLVQLLAGKVEERGGQKREHENAEKIAGRKRFHHFGAESEKVGAPGKSQKRRNPMRHAIEDLRVLEKINDDAEQAENATGGDQPAGIERSGAGLAFVLLLGGGFHQPADQAAGKHGSGGGDGKIAAGSKSQRANAENFHRDHQGTAHEQQ